VIARSSCGLETTCRAYEIWGGEAKNLYAVVYDTQRIRIPQEGSSQSSIINVVHHALPISTDAERHPRHQCPNVPPHASSPSSSRYRNIPQPHHMTLPEIESHPIPPSGPSHILHATNINCSGEAWKRTCVLCVPSCSFATWTRVLINAAACCALCSFGLADSVACRSVCIGVVSGRVWLRLEARERLFLGLALGLDWECFAILVILRYGGEKGGVDGFE
jgi:hypothetical protein